MKLKTFGEKEVLGVSEPVNANDPTPKEYVDRVVREHSEDTQLHLDAGRAETVTRLHTPRTINGVSFNGTADIVTSIWGTTRSFTVGSTTKAVNGSGNVAWTLAEIGAAAEGHSHPVASSSTDGLMPKEAWVKLNDIEEKANNFSLPVGTNGQVLKHNGTVWVPADDSNTTYSLMPEAELIAGISTSARTISSQRLKLAVEKHSGNIPLVTTAVAGLMSPEDKVKVNSLDSTYLGSNANAVSATKLATARTIGGVAFDGTTNINLPGVNALGNQNTSGNAASANKLYTARTIGGVVFDGTANINLPGVNTPGNQNTTGSAASLSSSRTINGTAFNATANIVTSFWGTARTLTIGSSAKSVNGSVNVAWTLVEIGAAPTSHSHVAADIPNLDASKITTGTFSVARIPTLNQNTTGNAETATKLVTACTINGTAFNGTANIVTSNWGTARTLTIGATGKSVNGSANVTWTLVEIGAAPTSHSHVIGNVTGLQAALNLKADKTEIVQKRDLTNTSFPRYDLASVATTATIDLSTSQVFRVDASSPRTLTFVNESGTDRAMTVVVHISGNSAVTWPVGIDWDSGAAPGLGDNETKVVLFWDGVEWSGFTRVAK